MTIAQARLVELQNDLHTEIGFRVRVTSDELTLIVDELVEKRDNPRYREIAELRADRVKLQGEIERLTHALAEAQAHLANLRALPETGTLFAQKGEGWLTIEALAQRLAKVEDRLAVQRAEIVVHKDILHRERLAKLEQAPERSVLYENVKITDAPFPTGAATTVDEVLETVQEAGQPSDDGPPRRGDRVRLEGARSLGGTKLEDRWYDVTGAAHGDFQVEGANGGRFWVLGIDPAVKEVRPGAAKLPE